MFLVSDTLESRQGKIEGFLETDQAIAVLLAAADFEWTVRRAIILLGRDSNREIRERDLYRASGLGKYQEAWTAQVVPDHTRPLREIVPDWDYFQNTAFDLRHKLIHGVQGGTGLNHATTCVTSILAATKSIVDFAANADKDVYSRLEVRR